MNIHPLDRERESIHIYTLLFSNVHAILKKSSVPEKKLVGNCLNVWRGTAGRERFWILF